MKKVFFISALAVALLTGFSSCSKCKVCTKSGGSEVKLCEKDYNSNTAYGLAVDAQVALGYNCK